jgi:hydrophobic/amphiphilic exporter-1 (mainly G- bacteria), HAE1 family
MTLSTALGLIFIPVTFAVVEYLSHRFVRGGSGTTMDSGHGICGPETDAKQPVVFARAEGGQA